MADFRIVEREGRDLLGEGPVWSAGRGGLFWVDIMAPALRFLDLESEVVSTWPMSEPIGWVIEREGRDDFIAGLKSGFAELSLSPVVCRSIGNPQPEHPNNRMNDAGVDPHGRIWAGTKDETDETATGALYRLDPDLGWSVHDEGYAVTNGPAFSLDGRTMFHTDSGARTIYAFDYTADGRIAGKREFVRFTDEWGYPDGMATDSAGGLWIAHWGGGRISRFGMDGKLDRSIALPAMNITSVAFAGDDLERMFVTSASLDGTGVAAGALFEVFTGATGLPTTRFAG